MLGDSPKEECCRCTPVALGRWRGRLLGPWHIQGHSTPLGGWTFRLPRHQSPHSGLRRKVWTSLWIEGDFWSGRGRQVVAARYAALACHVQTGRLRSVALDRSTAYMQQATVAVARGCFL